MFRHLRNSTVRHLREIASLIQNDGFALQYLDWDGHADEYELPDADLFGLSGFAVSNGTQFHDFVFSIGVVTYNDSNILRLTNIVDAFYREFEPMKTFIVYDENVQRIGVATIFDGTTVTPLARAEVRPAQAVQVTARFVRDGSDA